VLREPTQQAVRSAPALLSHQCHLSSITESMMAVRSAHRCHPSADCKDDGDVIDGWQVALMGDGMLLMGRWSPLLHGLTGLNYWCYSLCHIAPCSTHMLSSSVSNHICFLLLLLSL